MFYKFCRRLVLNWVLWFHKQPLCPSVPQPMMAFRQDRLSSSQIIDALLPANCSYLRAAVSSVGIVRGSKKMFIWLILEDVRPRPRSRVCCFTISTNQLKVAQMEQGGRGWRISRDQSLPQITDEGSFFGDNNNNNPPTHSLNHTKSPLHCDQNWRNITTLANQF